LNYFKYPFFVYHLYWLRTLPLNYWIRTILLTHWIKNYFLGKSKWFCRC